MGEHAAFEIRPDLSLHEPGDGRALPSRPSQKGLELLADDFVEQSLFGFVAFVFDGGRESIGIVRSSALNTKASDMPRRPPRESADGMDQSLARVRFYSCASRRSDAKPHGSHAQRDRVDSSLLIGSRAGPSHIGIGDPEIASRRSSAMLQWYRGQDSNLHVLRTVAPKATASTNSATPAMSSAQCLFKPIAIGRGKSGW